MRPFLLLLSFCATLFVCAQQPTTPNSNPTPKQNKSELLIGKWKPFEYNYLVNGKMKHLSNGKFYSLYEFKKDGSFLYSQYKNDTLVQLTTGKWKLSKKDSISYSNMSCDKNPNLATFMIPDKLVKVTRTELILTNKLFVPKSSVHSGGTKNSFIYFKRVR